MKDTMISPKIKYCDNCQKNVKANIIVRSATYTFKGESFDIIEKALICNCGEELYDETLDTETMQLLTKLYESGAVGKGEGG